MKTNQILGKNQSITNINIYLLDLFMLDTMNK